MLEKKDLDDLTKFLVEQAIIEVGVDDGLTSPKSYFECVKSILTDVYKEGLTQGFGDGKAFQEDLTNLNIPRGIDEDGQPY